MSDTSKISRSMDDIVALCRRRGFIWQSSEIYGGINGFWDYGPLGTELKRNLKEAWYHDVVRCPPLGPDGKPIRMLPLDTTIIMHPKVWEASGHVAGFNDPMVDDKESKRRFRADHLFGLFLAEWHEGVNFQTVAGELKRSILAFEIAPRATVVASTEGEAFEQFRADRKMILRDAQIIHTNVQIGETGADVLIVDRDGKKWLGEFKAIPMRFLETRYKELRSPERQRLGVLTEPRQFNLMFETYIGAIRDEENKAYLRPETAQGIFTQFWNVVDTSRVKIPFGIAQQGKAFRNEVTPRNFTFRSREFEQMEIEFFVHPSDAADWYEYWRGHRYQWWMSIGLTGENLQLRPHATDELAHYAKQGAGTSDIEYRFPFTAPGFGELEGVAHRSDFDLRAHATACGKGDKMMYFDQENNDRYFPHVIEPSAGADRGTLALLCEAYTPDETRPSKVYMKFHPRMAPLKAGIFPLVNKDGMPEVAEKLYLELRRKYAVEFDPKQNIGKRYARMDEAGTPYCFTVDGDTLKDQTVTVRDRDTQKQQRINLDAVGNFLSERIGE